MSEKVLFEDKDVKVTDQNLTIKCYFFPFGKAKVIPIKQIKKVEKRELGLTKYRIWGMDAGKNWGYWLAGDKSRMKREQYIGVTLPDSSIHPSFTTENVNFVYGLLRDLVEDAHPNNQQTKFQVSPSTNLLKPVKSY